MPIRRHVQNETPRSKSVQSSQNENRLNPLLFKSGKITKCVITKVIKNGTFAWNIFLQNLKLNYLDENVLTYILVIDQNHSNGAKNYFLKGNLIMQLNN